MPTLDNLTDCYEVLKYLQANIWDNVIREIFPDDTEHYIEKWRNSEYNIINFLNSLDQNNLEKVLTYGLHAIKK